MSIIEKLLPVPKKIELVKGKFELDKKSEVRTNFDAENEFKFLLNVVGLKTASGKFEKNDDILRMTIGDGELKSIEAPDNEEGYALSLNGKFVEIAANTKEGIAFALKTLIKIVTSGEEIPSMIITDYPDVEFRGIQFCIFNPDDGTEKDDTAPEDIKKRIFDAALTGYNIVFLEFWGMFPFVRHPYASWPKAYKMKEVRELVSFIIDDLYMDAIPEQNMTGHAGWSRIISRKHVVLDQRPDLADMWIPGGWCFATEREDTQAYLKDVMEELLEAFRNPKYYHICSDKTFGFGSSDIDRTRPADVLFLNHITRLNTFLQERGVTTVMWHDMVYACTDGLYWKATEGIADMLPKNIVFNVWTHNDPGKYWPDAKYFEDKGFRTLYSPFNQKDSILNMIMLSNKAKRDGKTNMGLIQTTWHRPDGVRDLYIMSGSMQWNFIEPTQEMIDNIKCLNKKLL